MMRVKWVTATCGAVGVALLLFSFPAFGDEHESDADADVEVLDGVGEDAYSDDDEDESDAAAADGDSGEIVDEMRITAQKRESDLQTTPVAVSAFNEDQLRDYGIANANELTEFTPNLTVRTGSAGNNFFITQRGVGSADTNNIMTTHGTGIYVDGIYNSFTIGTMLDVIDLEQVEVLRGPQGTLWGRNTSVGAVNFISRKPSGEFKTDLEVSTGYASLIDATAYVDIPIFGGEEGMGVTDKWGNLAASGSFNTANRDFLYRDPTIPANDEINRLAGRVAVRWWWEDTFFSDKFTIDYAWDIHQTNEVSGEQQLVWLDESGPNLLNGSTTGSGFGVDMRPYVSDTRRSNSGTDFSQKDSVNVSGHGVILAADYDDKPYIGNLTVKSITSVRQLDAHNFVDLDGSPFQVFHNDELTSSQQITQEIDLIGTKDLDWGEKSIGVLDYVIGYFYFQEKAEDILQQLAFTDPAFNPIFAPNPAPPPAFVPVNLGSTTILTPSIETHSNAFFTHLGLTPPFLDEAFKFEAGVRYTVDKKAVANSRTVIPTVGAPIPGSDWVATAGRKFDEVTPEGKVSYRLPAGLLDHTPVDSMFTYYSIGMGFNSGVFNARALNPAAFRDPALSETVLAHELGIKTRAADGRLQLNLAGFFMNYKDMQRTFLVAATAPGGGPTIASGVQNAGKANIAGMEAEIATSPFENVMLIGSYGLTIGTYIEYFQCDASLVPPAAADCQDVAARPGASVNRADDFQFANSPEHQVNVGAEYTFNQLSYMRVRVRLDYYWQSETLLQNGDNALAGASAFGILNGRVTFDEIELGGGLLDIGVWGRNLLDRKYRDFGIDYNNPLGATPFITYSFGDRRMVGIDIRLRY